MNKEQILEQLNDGQRKAVIYSEGPSLVIAGAGSGKTRVLTYKIAYLLESGLKPWQILALTFTNKAAREMKERIGHFVGEEQARYLQMGTFHSVFSRILRAEATLLGFSSDFTIYDQSDARSLVRTIIREMGLDDKIYKPGSVSDRISMAKNHLIFSGQYGQSAWGTDDVRERRPEIAKIYVRYAARCRQANAMDFDDLLLYTYLLFQEHEETRLRYAERFQYVLVDEYQDTNYAQQAIIYQLTRDRQKICVVGDDAQSIYSFRGANIDNILNFQKIYHDARLFKLEQNYRSTKHIVETANSLISKNARQIPKVVFSDNERGELVKLKSAYSDREEALIVCKDIKRIRRQENCEFSDFAILYRTNSQSRTFEEQMRKDNIPYRIYGGLSFYQRKEIKDVIAYFRLVVNPDDEEAFKRIINYPARGIGDTTMGKVSATANLHGVSLWQVINEPVLYGLDVNKGTLAKLQNFAELLRTWGERKEVEDAYELGHDIVMRSGISKDIYGGHEPEDISRQENLQEFLSGMKDFVDSRREEDMGEHIFLTDFLQEVALLTDLDSGNSDDDNKVLLMTIHAAKGLEFPTVFVVGLEENIFPSPMSTDNIRALEEERRLLYVAITRAEKRCIMTYAQNRYRYGRVEFDTPSRFIQDIDRRLLDVREEEDNRSWTMSKGTRESVRQKNLFDDVCQEVDGASWYEPIRQQLGNSFSTKARSAKTPVSFNSTQSLRDGRTSSVPNIHPTTSSARFTSVNRAAPPRPSANLGGQLKEGDVIEHQRFGIGTVLRVEGTGENQKATVEFRNSGTKQLLLKFAKYKKL